MSRTQKKLLPQHLSSNASPGGFPDEVHLKQLPKEKKAEKLMAQQRKDSAAHKIAVANYQKASKLRAKFESDEAKAKVKLLLLEAKLKTSAAEMEKAGVKKRKNAAVYDPAPIGRPAPPAAQLLNLGGDF